MVLTVLLLAQDMVGSTRLHQMAHVPNVGLLPMPLRGFSWLVHGAHRAQATAKGFGSMATTSQPILAIDCDITPVPQPISRKRPGGHSSRSKARCKSVESSLGGYTVRGTSMICRSPSPSIHSISNPLCCENSISRCIGVSHHPILLLRWFIEWGVDLLSDEGAKLLPFPAGKF